MSRPTLHQFEIFCKVLQLKNMARAAEELYLTPSSVTTQIRQLEQKYRIQLLVRSSRGIEPTVAGRALYQRALSILGDVDAAEREVADIGNLDRGVLQFAASRTIGTYLIPAVLSSFQRAYPNVAVEYLVKSGGDQARFAVLEQLVEFAVLGRIAADSALQVEELFDEPMRVVAAPEHPFASIEAPTLADLGGHRLLLRRGRILARDYINARLTQVGVAPDAEEFGNTEAIKDAAICGRGVAILPHTSVAGEIASGVLVARPVENFAPKRTAYVAHSTRAELSPAASAFLDMAGALNAAALSGVVE